MPDEPAITVIQPEVIVEPRPTPKPTIEEIGKQKEKRAKKLKKLFEGTPKVVKYCEVCSKRLEGFNIHRYRDHILCSEHQNLLEIFDRWTLENITEAEQKIVKMANKREAEIAEAFDFAKEEIAEISTNIFNNATFIQEFKKWITRSIEQEMAVLVKNADMYAVVAEVIRTESKSMFKDIIADIVREVVIAQNAKLRSDYEAAKDLCYSIDSEIKHCMMKAPISAMAEKEIVQHLHKAINTVSQKRLAIEAKPATEPKAEHFTFIRGDEPEPKKTLAPVREPNDEDRSFALDIMEACPPSINILIIAQKHSREMWYFEKKVHNSKCVADDVNSLIGWELLRSYENRKHNREYAITKKGFEILQHMKREVSK